LFVSLLSAASYDPAINLRSVLAHLSSLAVWRSARLVLNFLLVWGVIVAIVVVAVVDSIIIIIIISMSICL
jgi:hypothetical protein